MSERAIRGVFAGLLLALTLSLGITKVADYDAWTHLALGREIVHQRGFPANEPFSFPSLDMPFYNPEWLFDVVFYLAYVAAGITGVILLKASIVTIAFLILFKDSLIPQDQPAHRPLGVLTTILVLTLIVLMVKHRFVERPDIALMVFLAFTIYGLNAFVYEGKRYLYLLPLVQVVWVNMHPSIVVGAVPFCAFLFGGGLQLLLCERFGVDVPGTPSKSQLRIIAVVFAVVLAASFLNPYGIEAFFLPFRLAGSRWFTDEILELQVPKLTDLYGAPYIVTAVLILIFLINIKRPPLIYALLAGPFVYLGLSARRFVFLLGIVSAPIIARHLRSFASRLKAEWAHRMSLPAGILAAFLIVAVSGLSISGLEPFVDPLRVPGFGINYTPTPEGALRYLDRIGVSGKLYNRFKWGGYIEWRDYPRRKPIIDGRGQVSSDLLETIGSASTDPVSMQTLQQKFGIDVALMDYPGGIEVFGEELPDRDFALPSPDWALVYWDDLSLVYLRRTDAFAKIIQRDEYRLVKPANGPLYLKRKVRDNNLLPPIEAELRRNIAETHSFTGYVLLGSIYNAAGLYDKAIKVLGNVWGSPFGDLNLQAYWELAFAYDRIGKTETAIAYYEKVARATNNPTVLYSVGAAFDKIGNDREAIRYLELALKRDRNLIWGYPLLLTLYRKAGKTDRLPMLEAAYREALAHRQAKERFMRGLKLYVEGNIHGAMAEFQESLRLEPRNPQALINLGYVYFDLGFLDKALALQKQALEIDRKKANAHYGLALIYGARGEHAMARAHFEEYLRLEPKGYWSRKARDELSRIREP